MRTHRTRMSALPLTPAQRDLLLVALALFLLLTPLWSLPLDLGSRVYEYERVEVTVDGRTIDYATYPDGATPLPISDEFACARNIDERICAFESYLAANHSIPTNSWAAPGMPERAGSPFDRYSYVVLDRTYRTTIRTNDSSDPDDVSADSARVYLSLDPTSPHKALETVSVDAEDVPPTIRSAARTGSATHSGPVEVPTTPVRTDDGYYRMYKANVSEFSVLAGFVGVVLRFFVPVVGLGLLIGLRGRFAVRHVSDTDER